MRTVNVKVNPAWLISGSLTLLILSVHLPAAFGVLLATMTVAMLNAHAQHHYLAAAQLGGMYIAGIVASGNLAIYDLAVAITIAVLTYTWRLSTMGTNPTRGDRQHVQQ